MGTCRFYRPGAAWLTFESAEEIAMRDEITTIIEKDGDWFIAYSPLVAGANGQGRTEDETRENHAEAVALILADRSEDRLGKAPDEP